MGCWEVEFRVVRLLREIVGRGRTWHSTKCPIRALAMTGMVTVSMISLIIWGSLIRATPPWALMSAGTRSRAITATAPASSAMRACIRLSASVSKVPVWSWSNWKYARRETYLLSVDDVHDNATLEHAGKTSLDGEVVLAILGSVAVCGGEFSCHCVCL